jgi:broad specificity phosphatase PhoE
VGTIILVRHGQASFGSSNYDQLSPLGFEQAKVLGAHLKQRLPKVDVALMGSMRRHRETAETCLAAMGGDLPLTEDARLNEYTFEAILQAHTPRYADLKHMRDDLARSGNPQKAFQAVFAEAMARWTGGEFDDEYQESWPVFKQRCSTALDSLVASLGPSKTALVFTSGGFIGVTVQRLLGLTAKQAFAFNWNIANGSISKLLYGSRGLSLQSFNEHGHLETTDGHLLSFR